MNLFNIIPDNMFGLLTGINRKVYFDCLSKIYQLSDNEQSFSLDKSLVAEELKEYFESHKIEAEDGDDQDHNPRTKANNFLRKLKSSGWIDEDYVGSTLKISIPDYAQTLLEAMIKIVKEEELEYKTSIHNIYSIIINKSNFREPYSLIVKNVYDIMQELVKSLKRLNTNIKKHVDKIASQKSPKEVLESLQLFYTEIISKAYSRVKNDNNISRYKVDIIEVIESILSDQYFDLAINDCISKESNIDNYDDASNKLKNLIYDIKLSFNAYDSIMMNVDDRYNKFLKSAVERAHYLMSTDSNLKGRINIIIQKLLKINENSQSDINSYDEVTEKFLKIYTQKNLTNDSLYVQKSKTKNLQLLDIENIQTISLEERERLQKEELLKLNNSYSLKNINEYISKNIKLNEKVFINSLPILNDKDSIRIIYIYLYASNKNAIYKVNLSKNKIKYGNYYFKNFEIERIR